eukprot:gene19206-biopygen5925
MISSCSNRPADLTVAAEWDGQVSAASPLDLAHTQPATTTCNVTEHLVGFGQNSMIMTSDPHLFIISKLHLIPTRFPMRITSVTQLLQLGKRVPVLYQYNTAPDQGSVVHALQHGRKAKVLNAEVTGLLGAEWHLSLSDSVGLSSPGLTNLLLFRLRHPAYDLSSVAITFEKYWC